MEQVLLSDDDMSLNIVKAKANIETLIGAMEET